MDLDFIIVGADFSGSVIAERLASAGRKVRNINKRDHMDQAVGAALKKLRRPSIPAGTDS